MKVDGRPEPVVGGRRLSEDIEALAALAVLFVLNALFVFALVMP